MRLREKSLAENKYARPEFERRFLIRDIPSDLNRSYYVRIRDGYLTGTRLRLRCMEWPDGTVQYKFAMKFADQSLPPGVVGVTNLYLDKAEYTSLRALAGVDMILKRRHSYEYRRLLYSIDIFEGELEGLTLAERGVDTSDQFVNCVTPDFAIADVTTDLFFTGGMLSKVSHVDLSRVLAERFNRA